MTMIVHPVLFALVFATAVVAHAEPPAKQAASTTPHRHEHGSVPAVKPVLGTSIYQLDVPWKDQHGKVRRLREFRGKPVVLAMVYTHCQHVCPRIIGDIRRIRASLTDKTRGQVQLVVVSIDPERDTVQRLADFGKETGLTKQGWVLLRGDGDNVRSLAAVLGVSYRPAGPSDFAHSNVITVLDREGVIAHQQVGLGQEPVKSVAALETLVPSTSKHDK